jgi:opacity protein-like surface antigen
MTHGVIRALFLFLLVLAASSGFAQSFRFAVEGGVPLTSAFETGTSEALPTPVPIGSWSETVTYSSSTRRYTVGASAELELPFQLAIQAGVLYKRLGFDYLSAGVLTGTALAASVTGSGTANSWEFPLLAKYGVGSRGPLQPYVEAGVVLRHLQGVSETNSTTAVPQIIPASALSHSFTPGFTAGAGLELRHRLAGVFGEIRYTRWTQDAFSAPEGGLNSARNQAELLLGVTF